jgi:hypothetical protein
MREMMRAAVVAMCSTLAACRGSTPLGSNLLVQARPDAAADAAPLQSGGGPANGDASKTIVAAADAATETPPTDMPPAETPPASDDSPAEAQPPFVDAAPTEVAPAPGDAASDTAKLDAAALISCAELAAGGKADRLKTFQWMIQTSFNQALYDTVTIDGGCKLTYQYEVMTPTAPKSTTQTTTMSPDDCAAARAWVTNARFLQVLDTGENCPFGPGNPGDVFDLTLTDVGRVARKTYLCPEPTVEAVRACLRPLVARLFPR